MKRGGKGQIALLVGGLLALLTLYGIGTSGQVKEQQTTLPRARWDDATPFGGKGYRLLLQRLGFNLKRADLRLQAMPQDARVWVLLDPQTHFSRAEQGLLLAWVKAGNTLIYAPPPPSYAISLNREADESSELEELQDQLGVRVQPDWNFYFQHDDPLPVPKPLDQGAASVYWAGVKDAESSPAQLELSKPYLEVAGSPIGPEIARLDWGKGRVFVLPDAFLCTNYGLSRRDNAVLVTNFVRAHAPTGAAIYFDERQHGELEGDKVTPNLLYYLWRPPLRWAILQLGAALLLSWALFGRRLGAPVGLAEAEPVTRASNFARAMGALFRKAGRPQEAGAILAQEFRRRLARRLGLSVSDPDELLAQRAGEAADLPAPLMLRLLKRAQVEVAAPSQPFDLAPKMIDRLAHGAPPQENEAELLRDAQEMEHVLRRLNIH